MDERGSGQATGRFQLNVVFIVFGIIFIYMIVTVFLNMTRSHISFFEAENGEISDTDTFTGVILRTEQVMKSPSGGYISFYVGNGEKSARNEPVCLIKKASETAQKKTDEQTYTVTDSDYSDIREQMRGFARTYSDSSFHRVKDLHFGLSNITGEIASRQEISSASEAGEGTGIYDAITCTSSGIVSYTTDGMEGTQRKDLTQDLFDRALKEEKSQLEAGSYVKAGQDVCRVIYGEDWEIVIRPDERQLQKIKACLKEADGKSAQVTVNFPNQDISAAAGLELFESGGKEYASLKMDNYQVRFAQERCTDLELVWNSYSGIKIPATALTKREYYMIPVSFLVTKEGSSQEGFYVKGEDGNSFVKPGIVSRRGDFLYVDMDQLEAGTVLEEPGTGKTCTVNQTSALDGVYTINQGYTRFCLVNILYSYGDYSIIENAGEGSSVKLYDRVVLDGSSVENKQIVY